MKKLFAIVSVLFVVTISANAQNRPTQARPMPDSELSTAMKTYGRHTEEAVWTKFDSNSEIKDTRLTGLAVNAYAGATCDGADLGLGIDYQIRSAKYPKLRSVIFNGSLGVQQIELDGEKQWGYGAKGHIMFDPMVFIAPKSGFVLQGGVGFSYTHIEFQKRYDVVGEKETVSFNRDFKGNPFSLSVKGRIGYEFSKQFAIMGEVSYTGFEVSRKPDLPIKKSYLSAGITLQWKFERKVRK